MPTYKPFTINALPSFVVLITKRSVRYRTVMSIFEQNLKSALQVTIYNYIQILKRVLVYQIYHQPKYQVLIFQKFSSILNNWSKAST